MKLLKRGLCILITLALLVTPALASRNLVISPSGLIAANALYELGLFSGVGTDSATGKPNFDLERTPTRTEAVTVLVRLLGKENEAKAGTWQTPFTDNIAAWALPYVGYAYCNNLTTGNTATTFGGDQLMDANQYTTLVLRALGYSSSTDFTWNTALDFAKSLGFSCWDYKPFTRGDMASLSYMSIQSPLKGNGETLLAQLVNNGAVTVAQIETASSTPDTEILNPTATYEDLAHFLVKYFPIKSYVNKYTRDNVTWIKEDTRYVDDILTMLNAGIIDDFYFSPNTDVYSATFATLICRLIADSGCDVEDILPQTYSKTDKYYSYSMAVMQKLGIFPDDSLKDISVYLLSELTANKIKAVPNGEKIGTVSMIAESFSPKYLELDGTVCSTRSWDNLSIQKMNVNGVDALYISAPSAYTTDTDWSGGGTPALYSLLCYAKGDYKIVATDNPFLGGQVSETGLKSLVQTSKKEEYTSATSKKIYYTVTASGKTLTSTDFPAGGIADVKGIEYVNDYLNINDVFAYYGIKKTVTIEKQGDLEVLCFR